MWTVMLHELRLALLFPMEIPLPQMLLPVLVGTPRARMSRWALPNVTVKGRRAPVLLVVRKLARTKLVGMALVGTATACAPLLVECTTPECAPALIAIKSLLRRRSLGMRMGAESLCTGVH